jgi:hypothetical protein
MNETDIAGMWWVLSVVIASDSQKIDLFGANLQHWFR